MNFLYFVFAVLAFAKDQNNDAGWYKGDHGQTCDDKCGSLGLKCNSDKQSTITTCNLLIDALAEAGSECESCNDATSGRDYAGSPFLQSGKICYFLNPGKTSVCDANKYSGHAPLCYCDKEEGDECSVFDIDSFLTDCSEKFPAAQKVLGEVQTRMDEEVTTAIEAVNRKVDEQVARLDALIDEVQATLTTMANLNAAQSEFGNVDGVMMTDSMSHGSKNLMIYALVMFNIGTLMGCVSCLYWSQKNQVGGDQLK